MSTEYRIPVYGISYIKPCRDTKFGTNVSNKILLKAPKCQCYSFHRFWVIKGEPTGGRGGGGVRLTHSPRLGLMIAMHCLWAKSNNRTRGQFEYDVTWFCFCFDFDCSHARCGMRLLFHSLFTLSRCANKTHWLQNEY